MQNPKLCPWDLGSTYSCDFLLTDLEVIELRHPKSFIKQKVFQLISQCHGLVSSYLFKILPSSIIRNWQTWQISFNYDSPVFKMYELLVIWKRAQVNHLFFWNCADRNMTDTLINCLIIDFGMLLLTNKRIFPRLKVKVVN